MTEEDKKWIETNNSVCAMLRHAHDVLSLSSLPPTPKQKPWVGLTDEEVIAMSKYDLEYAALIGEVQKKLKEKNT